MRILDVIKGHHRIRLAIFAVLLLGFASVLVLATLVGTDRESSRTHRSVRAAIPIHQATRRQVQLYFALGNQWHLQAEERRVEISDPVNSAESILQALLAGPQNPRLISPIPEGTRLLHLFITEDGTAYADFSTELVRRHPGGVAAERLTLYAIVNTLALNLDEVERVQILVEGKPAPTLAGHLDIRHPKSAELLVVR